MELNKTQPASLRVIAGLGRTAPLKEKTLNKSSPYMLVSKRITGQGSSIPEIIIGESTSIMIMCRNNYKALESRLERRSQV